MERNSAKTLNDISNEAFAAYAAKHPPVPYTEWDDDGCIELVTALIRDARQAYIGTRTTYYAFIGKYGEHPEHPDALRRLYEIKRSVNAGEAFFRSAMFHTFAAICSIDVDSVIADMCKEAFKAAGRGKSINGYSDTERIDDMLATRCNYCGKPLDPKRDEGRKRCSECRGFFRHQALDRSRRKRYEAIAEHRCTICGGMLPEGYSLLSCRKCLDRAAFYKRRSITKRALAALND